MKKCVTGPSVNYWSRTAAEDYRIQAPDYYRLHAPDLCIESASMNVGVARETTAGERRVAVVPETVGKLVAAGFQVTVEPGAGTAASFPDDAYRDAGATLASPWEADVLVKVRKPDAAEAARLRSGQILIGYLDPLADPDSVAALGSSGVIAFAMESIPRITRAQSMDALSSQATVGGYKAALLAAENLPRFFPMLMTAAGTVPPAKVLVIGAGVAGLQALATARRLGAIVTGFDVRPAVREQIESLGANWLDLGVTGAEAEGGYARELTPEEMQAQQQALEARIGDFDVVITTAAVPGRAAPKIIPESAVRAMKPGSVIVDLAAETGGNCVLTEPGQIVEREGVTLVGLTNLPSTMPYHASTLYSRNVQTLLLHLAPGGELNLDWSDEITAGACVAGKKEAPAA
jgi:NAD(P) transhydrogenase subunit alpha